MGVTAKCPNCGSIFRVNTIINIGTFWHPIWRIVCQKCGNPVDSDAGLQKDVIAGLLTVGMPLGEYWLQQYFSRNYEKYGFKSIEGPFDSGPDFIGVFKGERVKIEVEWTPKDFILHRHHQNIKFKEVKVLIVFEDDVPPDIKKIIPQTIIKINHDDFQTWLAELKPKYIKNQQLKRLINLVINEIARKFVYKCPDKDKDMAVCPECKLCTYFPQHEVDFEKQALNLLNNAEKILYASDEGKKIYANALSSNNYIDYYCALLDKVTYLLDQN